MKFVVTSDNLNLGLRRVMNAISPKPVSPVMANVLLEAKDDQLTITGSDSELRISTIVPAQVIDEGAITLQAKKFNEISGALANGDVSIESVEGDAVQLNCQKASFTINGITASDYPEAEPFTEDWCFTIGGKELVYAARGVVGRTYEAMFPYLGAALIYLILVMLFTWLLKIFERRLRASDRR